MRKKKTQNHYSDEVLLAHLDGELRRRTEIAVKEHLNACWECRARLAELEEQAEAVTRSFAQQTFPGPDRIEEARRRFFGWQEEFERALLLEAKLGSVSSLWARVRVAAVAAIFLCLVGLGVWHASREFVPEPSVVLARTQKVEAEQIQGAFAVHQTLRVDVVPIRPKGPERVSQLEVWSEPDRRRFASRWNDSGGVLRHAVWRPDRERQYFYAPGVTPTLVSSTKVDPKVQVLSELSDYGLTPEELERGFMRWLEGRRWRPVVLASDFAVFASQDGVVLRTERIRLGDGRPGIRLVAQREREGLQVRMTMDVDASGYWPRLQTIRFETPERAMEIRLTVQQTERLSPQQLRPAIFEPDPKLVSVERSSLEVEAPAPQPRIYSEEELAELEVDALHRLNRIGAVLGQQVSLERTPEGKLRVQAVVETEQRKQEILQALAPFRNHPAVKLEVETVAEAVERNAEPLSGPVILSEVEITSEPTPVYAELRQLFLSAEELPAGASEDEEIRRFAKQMLDRSQQALLHAWALKHFVARFSPEELRALQPEARAKWFSLIREHARGFRQQTELLRRRIEPIFFPGASSQEREETKVEIADDAELDPAVERLFQMSAAHDEALRSAFVISVEKQTLGKIKSQQFRRSLIASERLAMRIESGAGNAPR